MRRIAQQRPLSHREGYWRPVSDAVSAINHLGKYRYKWDKQPPRDITAAIYSFYVRTGSTLPCIAADGTELLYVGMTDSSLAIRNHFEHKHSGFSTLRRTLGALLKSELNLTAIPRSLGHSKANVRNFRFLDCDEERLTEWMRKNLLYSYVAVEGDVREIERKVISALKPPLNLTGCRTQYGAEIRFRRKICRTEAECSCG